MKVLIDFQHNQLCSLTWNTFPIMNVLMAHVEILILDLYSIYSTLEQSINELF